MNCANAQLEFIDFSRDRVRPAGGGQLISGFWVFDRISQEVVHVAYTLGCTREHIYHLIDEGAFENALPIETDSAGRQCWRIPRQSVIEFINSRKT